MNHLTIEEATEFFSEFYRGEHHIPNYKPKQYGYGFCVCHDRGGLATFDFNELTRLVIMAHDKCIRVEIMPKGRDTMIIGIWKREREGSMSHRHPTLEDAIEAFRKSATPSPATT